MTDKRTKSWTFILYPESVPENWREIIDSEHISWVESPLHDKDKTEEGELKKPHIHILLLFDSLKSYQQAHSVSERVNGTIPQKCASAKGLVRYMIHLDNPEKHQYDKNLVIAHGGADLGTLFAPTASQRYEKIKEMTEFIRDSGIVEFEDLFMYAMKYRYSDWFPLLCDSCAMVISMLLKSRRYRGLSKINGKWEQIDARKT